MLRRSLLGVAVVLALAIGLMAMSTAWAAKGATPEKIDKHLAMLKERLNLTDVQTQKIRAILEESQMEHMAMKDKPMTDQAAAAKMHEEHRKAMDEKIKAVLTAEQKKEYDKMIMENHQAMKDKSGQKNSAKTAPGTWNESGTSTKSGTGY